MSKTTIDGKVYPEATDHTRTWEWWQALAESSPPLVVPNQAARPVQFPGRIIYQQDDASALYLSNGTRWLRFIAEDAVQVRSGLTQTTTNAAGGFSINFPRPFPSGVVPAITANDANATGSFLNAIGFIGGAVTAVSAGGVIRAVQNGSPVGNTSVAIAWVAIWVAS